MTIETDYQVTLLDGNGAPCARSTITTTDEDSLFQAVSQLALAHGAQRARIACFVPAHWWQQAEGPQGSAFRQRVRTWEMDLRMNRSATGPWQNTLLVLGSCKAALESYLYDDTTTAQNELLKAAIEHVQFAITATHTVFTKLAEPDETSSE